MPMLIKITTPFIFFLLVSFNCLSQKTTFLGIHFAQNKDEFKFLDSGNLLSSFPYNSMELGIKIRRNLKNNISLDAGLKWKRFNHPTGIPTDFVKANNFMLPLDLNYRYLIHRKYKIYLVPTVGAYFGYNPAQKTIRSGEGIATPIRAFLPPSSDDKFNYSYQSKIGQNRGGAKAGITMEFTIFKESFLKIGFYKTSSFFKIYENQTIYTRDNLVYNYGEMSSHGAYQSILVDFYFPLR